VTPPVATDDTATVVRSGNVSINVAANDTSASSTIDPASITITQQPTSGTAVANADGTVTYTNNGAAATSDSFQYTIKDQEGNVSNTATVSITVVAALAAVNDTGSVIEDAATNTATGNVLANDTGGVGTKTVSAVNGVAANVGTVVAGQFGTFNIAANGAFTYTLDNTNTFVNALNAQDTLTDSMPYTVSAGGATAIGTLAITIQGHTD
jgi:VCBS repeat-containing protein